MYISQIAVFTYCTKIPFDGKKFGIVYYSCMYLNYSYLQDLEKFHGTKKFKRSFLSKKGFFVIVLHINHIVAFAMNNKNM